MQITLIDLIDGAFVDRGIPTDRVGYKGFLDVYFPQRQFRELVEQITRKDPGRRKGSEERFTNDLTRLILENSKNKKEKLFEYCERIFELIATEPGYSIEEDSEGSRVLRKPLASGGTGKVKYSSFATACSDARKKLGLTKNTNNPKKVISKGKIQ